MTTIFSYAPWFFAASTPAKPIPKQKDSWPLMGDVMGVRAGVPEVLIQWRRAQGLPDPDPVTRR